MKIYVLFVGVSLLAGMIAEKSEKAAFPSDMRFLTRSLKDRVLWKRNLCAKYGQQCGDVVDCCGNLECHYYDDYNGKCFSNK